MLLRGYRAFAGMGLTLGLILASPAMAAQDGFGNEGFSGSYFTASASKALGDEDESMTMAMDGSSVSGIEPAAGEEASDLEQDIEDRQTSPSVGETTPTSSANVPPVGASMAKPHTEAAINKALGEPYDTDAERKVTDRGRDAAQIHDTYGAGNVNLFQTQTTNGRVMDDDTAAGVQLKVLKFNK